MRPHLIASPMLLGALLTGPADARFLQADPVGYKADQNVYVYVANDPVDRADPSGLYGCDSSLTSGQCTQFTTAQSAARTQITTSITRLTTLKADIASGKLTNQDRALAATVDKFMGAGSGANMATLDKLIGTATNMVKVLDSAMPAGMATRQEVTSSHGDYALANPGRLSLLPSFFANPNNRAADVQRMQTVGHESHHHGVADSIDWAYGARNSALEAQRWGPTISLSNPDSVTFALGFQRTDGWQ